MNKRNVLPAACLAAIAGLTVTAAWSLGDGDGGAASGLDMSVSGASATTSGTLDIQVTTSGITTPPADNANAKFFALYWCTVSCNVGTIRIPFQASMNYNHPYISSAAYRVNAQGRLEQLTAAWIKHAFSSASATQNAVAGPNGQPACGTPPCGTGSGAIMGLNCSDTYGSGLNGQTTNLGPRGEIIPNHPGINVDAGEPLPPGYTFLGWNPRGSFFDTFQGASGTDNNLFVNGNTATYANSGRSYTTASSNTGWKLNMMRTDEIDPVALGPSGRLIFETYYVLNGDVNKHNNHAWRKIRYTKPADVAGVQQVPTAAAFAMDGPHTFGPPILAYCDSASVAQPSTEGTVYVASRVVDLGEGQWRYEYSVYNEDLHRQVGAFEVPIPSVCATTSFGFHQPRQSTFWLDPILGTTAPYTGLIIGARQRWIDTQPWTMSIDETKDALVAAMIPVADNANPPAASNPTLPNSIRWGTMYSFWFTSDCPPRNNGSAKVVQYRPGTNGDLSAQVRVPKAPCDVTNIGGDGPPDGQPTLDDILTFINAYNDENLLADLCGIGGVQPGDGLLTLDDILLFINSYNDWQ